MTVPWPRTWDDRSLGGLKASLRLEPIEKADAFRVLERHPLGVGCKTISFALGVFWNGVLHGVQTWGSPSVNGAGHSLGLRQHEMLQLHKFWLSDVPPRNAESRSLAVAARIIGSRYPDRRLLYTYCEEDERAASYRGAGWVLVATSTHANLMRHPSGAVLTVRDYNRKGGRKVLGPDWTPNRVSKAKYVLPLDRTLAPLVQRQHATLPARRWRFNSDQGAPPAATDSDPSASSAPDVPTR